jgi:hypothetical protein
MRDLRDLDRFRVHDGGWSGDGAHGAFVVPFGQPPHPRARLRVIASADPDIGWEHVSVSLAQRVPRYEEMVHIGDLFFLPEETWIQYRVPKRDHINIHPYVLHWWRPLKANIPMPEAWLV